MDYVVGGCYYVVFFVVVGGDCVLYVGVFDCEYCVGVGDYVYFDLFVYYLC